MGTPSAVSLSNCRSDICGDRGNDCCAPGSEARSCTLPGFAVQSGGVSAYAGCLASFGQGAIYQCCATSTPPAPPVTPPFVSVLTSCIQQLGAEAEATYSEWGNPCLPTTTRINMQSTILERVLRPVFDRYGYPAALWCASYTLRDRKTAEAWMQYHNLLCPWDRGSTCWGDPLGQDEDSGVPVKLSEAEYVEHVGGERYTMSCALCGHLQRALGPPPFVVTPDTPDHDERWDMRWDMHAFGVWLANDRSMRARGAEASMRLISKYRGSYGNTGILNVVHSFVWEGCRQLALSASSEHKMNQKRPVAPLSEAVVTEHVLRTCRSTWDLRDQSRHDCAHAAGHGFFEYFHSIQAAPV